MFYGIALSIVNYDALLAGWSALTLQNDVTFDAGFSHYTDNISRQHIIDTYGWTITDSGAPSAPSEPRSVEAVAVDDAIELTWLAPNDIGGYPITEYRIYRNTTDTEFSYIGNSSTLSYTDTDISFGITYSYNVTAVNILGEGANSSEVSVDLRPSISSPADFTYELGATGNEIVWTIADVNADSYNLTINGILSISDVWTSGTITVNVDGLAVGQYNFTIYLNDTGGNMISDSVIVTVTEVVETSSDADTSTISSDNPTNTTEPEDEGNNNTTVVIVVVVIIAGVVITVVVVKKKGLI